MKKLFRTVIALILCISMIIPSVRFSYADDEHDHEHTELEEETLELNIGEETPEVTEASDGIVSFEEPAYNAETIIRVRPT